MLKTRLSIALALVMTLSLLVAPVAYAADGDLPGSFNLGNSPPDIPDDPTASLELYGTAACDEAPITSMTPQTEYWVKVTVDDANTIDDIDEIEVQLFYDATPSNPTAPGADNTQTCAVFLWDKDGGGSEWTMLNPTAGDATWSIEDTDCVAPTTMTAGSGDWKFAFKPGKVATESPGTDNWDIYAKATDSAPQSDTKYKRDKEMLFYGEIAVSDTAAWGTVTPGTGFLDDTNEKGSISVKYIANGDYDQKVKSSAPWDGTLPNVATFDITGACTNSNEFSLKAFYTDTFTSAVQVLTASGVSINNTSPDQTVEAGDTESNNTLWLKLASPFLEDTYSGTITYMIGNR